ncbi:hypothetical protein ESY86_18335 [Subsaximicrobium wynnwilliamsii]|uniref:Uncharacterized protein n=1 Tax=Subsaximicrobium wynnwilliamsii TaxID=291179 RepID=A0A5C6ZD88_9FLAO|nr:hypothetical protein [Subsaximicrobium wynnwilliamsii]TXD81899.1 hypothetical protein ESY87_16245 [Subsaximicrobium wynnwilliamsii]TXD87018.1 hypothetical protein ESY86_18335 [Subsaximicrobium wynnwilliamsii]TXE01350.1 hypothetical protein ESY88_16235 [Subsaximicrobium wynnwilliamsii]
MTKTYPYDITFKVQMTDKKGSEIIDNGIIPWISIDDPKLEIVNLHDRDEIVISENKVVFVIEYPLTKPAEINIDAKTNLGFTRAELVSAVSAAYHRIYKEELETSIIKTIPVEEREGTVNRNETNGSYGIWGHDIGDLVLVAVEARKTESGELKLELIVAS